jgi:hypothetical protein
MLCLTAVNFTVKVPWSSAKRIGVPIHFRTQNRFLAAFP